MGGDDVEGLHEGLLRDLPVASQDLRDVSLLVAALQRPSRELAIELVTEELAQRLRIGVGIDEYEAAPRADFRFRQRPFGRLDMGEIPLAGNVSQGAVDIPCKAVKRTSKLPRSPALLLAQDSTAMEACVVKGLDALGGRANDEKRHPGDLINDMIADFGNILLAAGHLPYPLPQPFDLELEEFAGDVTFDGDFGGRQLDRILHPENLGHRMRVGVEQVLIGEPVPASFDLTGRHRHLRRDGRVPKAPSGVESDEGRVLRPIDTCADRRKGFRPKCRFRRRETDRFCRPSRPGRFHRAEGRRLHRSADASGSASVPLLSIAGHRASGDHADATHAARERAPDHHPLTTGQALALIDSRLTWRWKWMLEMKSRMARRHSSLRSGCAGTDL